MRRRITKAEFTFLHGHVDDTKAVDQRIVWERRIKRCPGDTEHRN